MRKHRLAGESDGFRDAHSVREVHRDADGTREVGELPDVLAVGGRDVDLRDPADAGRRLVSVHGGDEPLDVLDARRARDRHGVRPAELAAVPLLRVVGGGDHHRTIGLEGTVREIAYRRGCKTDVEDLHALVHKSLRERLEKRIRRPAAVPRDDDLAALHARELRICAGNLVEIGFDKVLAVDPADVVCLENAHSGSLPSFVTCVYSTIFSVI